MKILNLGCGTKTSASPDVVNVDWSAYLRIKRSPLARIAAPLLIGGKRLLRFGSLSNNVVVHNLTNGIPFPSNSVDIAYHSHFLEHLDRSVARDFLAEVRRVLVPGGIQRIVVPDFRKQCAEYCAHLTLCEHDPGEIAKHDSFVAEILSAVVRRESFGTSQQRPLRRFVENVLLGDARRRGDTHQWMYDWANLGALLESLGFTNFKQQTYITSRIADWNGYGLDLDDQGNEYKLGSLYVEVQK